MAQRNRERDFHPPVPVEDDTENGRHLDEVRLTERENETVGREDDKDNRSSKTRNDAHSSELSEAESVLPNEQPFMSRSEPSNEYDEFAKQETSTSLPTDGCFDKETGFGEKLRFIGLGSGTITKGYPHGTQIVEIRGGICFQKT